MDTMRAGSGAWWLQIAWTLLTGVITILCIWGWVTTKPYGFHDAMLDLPFPLYFVAALIGWIPKPLWYVRYPVMLAGFILFVTLAVATVQVWRSDPPDFHFKMIGLMPLPSLGDMLRNWDAMLIILYLPVMALVWFVWRRLSTKKSA